MEVIAKSVAAALAATIMGLLIKQKNPELTMLLSLSTVVLILLSTLPFLNDFRELLTTVNQISGRQEIYAGPLMKCFALSLLTKISAELCTEASNRAAAAAVELAGTLCAVSMIMPLMTSILKLIGDLD